MRGRLLHVALGVASALALAGAALAGSGGDSPSAAPPLDRDAHVFSSCRGIQGEFWSLGITNRDRIVIAANGLTSELRIYPPRADDANWRDVAALRGTIRNGSDSEELTVDAGQGDGRYLIYVDCVGTSKAYDFLVESIRHAIRIQASPRPSSTALRGRFRARLVDGNGQPLADSRVRVVLFGAWSGKRRTLGRSAVSRGAVAIPYRLAPALRGKRVTLWAATAATEEYQAASTPRVSLRVR